MKKTNILAETFGEQKRWVNYRMVTLKGKVTKIPYSVTGAKASSTDPATWATYADALKVSPQVGIVFTPDQLLLGIDIDHCLKGNKIIHEQKEIIEAFIKEADTYTEISPSGEGLHLFLELDAPLVLTAHKKAPFEAYTSGRYFTVTNNAYGAHRPVRRVSTVEALKILSIIGYPWEKIEEKADASSASQVNRGTVPESLTDEALLRKMFAAKNGNHIHFVYDGDLSTYKDDASAADMALLSHLAFWTRKDATQMERIWLSSPLGSRKKTQTRKDYRDRSIAKAIKDCTTIYESQAQKIEKANPELDLLYSLGRGGEKIFTMNTENIHRILKGHAEFAGRLRFDAFRNVIDIRPENEWRPFGNGDEIQIQTRISILFPCFGKVGKEMIYDAVIKTARDNTVDSALDYIRAIKWDGKARLDSWLTETYGVENNAYHTAVGANWLKGLVKRIAFPGCKFDYVIVLEGPQGSKKSTSLAVLGGAWHVETTMSTDSKDFFMQFQGKAIIEFSEGETMSRTEVKKMKAIITTQVDRYRAPYSRTTEDFARRCVFAMTTNQEEYLKDETGNRRWLPILVVLPEANVAWLEVNRDQLFAEAYERVMVKKESIYEFPTEATLFEQDKRRIHYENEDMIVDWYWNKLNPFQRGEGITVQQVYRDVLYASYPTKPIDKYTEMRIGETLRGALHLDHKRILSGGVRMWRWFNKETVPVETETEKEARLMWEV